MNSPATKEKILIVDDEPDIRKILEMHLKLHGYQVVCASGGNEGLDKAREFLPDLIILDMMMPDRDGSQVCRILKRDDETKNIPIIFLTAQGKREHKLEGFESGAVDYITKPFDMGELVARISSQLKIQSLYREISNYVHQLSLDLDLARRVQKCIIPQWIPFLPRLELAASYFSTEKVGGDYFDFFHLKESQMGIMVADVSGHGISASFITAMAKMAFKHNISRSNSLTDIFRLVNDDFYEILKTEHYLTAFMVALDTQNKTLTYAKAGHVDQILQKASNELQSLETKGFFLGVFEDGGYEEKTCCLDSGDKLVLFTDGLIEARNPAGEQYGIDRFREFLKKNKHLDVATLDRALSEDQRHFLQGKARSDDHTVVLIQMKDRTIHEELVEWAQFPQGTLTYFLHLYPPYPLSGELHRMMEEMGNRGFSGEKLREIKMALHALINLSLLACREENQVLHFGWTGNAKQFNAVLARLNEGKFNEMSPSLCQILKEGQQSALAIALRVFTQIKEHPSGEALSLTVSRST